MMKTTKWAWLLCFSLCTTMATAQTAAKAAAQAAEIDSLQNAQDSLVRELQSQLQEFKMQQIMLQEELERTGQRYVNDSLAEVQRKMRVDSLRQITPGAPLIFDDDTLFVLYARKGGKLAETRVREAKEMITAIGQSLSFTVDSIYTFEDELSTDIMVGSQVIVSITDMDGLWQHKSRTELANEYLPIIKQTIDDLHEKYGLQQKIRGILMAAALLFVLYLLIRFTNWVFGHFRMKLIRKVVNLLRPISTENYKFLNIHRQCVMVMIAYNTLRYILIVIYLFLVIPTLFYIFPETQTFTMTVFSYIWDPFKDIVKAVIDYIPNIFQIAVIWVCFYYLVRFIRYICNEIAADRLKISGFYPDWARPTYFILRVLLYSLMFVMIWPLLPNSNSQVFQGVSVFIGIIVSLGSTSIIGNLISGMVMTYMRLFSIGDYIKVGDIVGEVVEKTILVTRIRTRKNEVITIQNSNLMGSQTSNYTVAAKNYLLIVHTKVTIGYDVPWQKVKEIMESAALETPGIKHKPRPFMMTTALDDYYVEYEINAYTDDAVKLSAIYSNLHQNLLKRFFEEGVEIMSPHIYAHRTDLELQMPPEFKQELETPQPEQNEAPKKK